MKVQSKGNYLIINGNYYVPSKIIEDGNFNTSEIIWRKVDRKQLEEKINRIVEKLRTCLDSGVVIADALRATDRETLNALDRKLKSKKKIKIKTEKHCVRMDIGGTKLQIRG